VAQWQQTCRQQAESNDSLANTATSDTDRARHVVLALLWRLLCGFVVGIVIGYASHLILDATALRSLALLF
jgi:NhaP-type Na+/H+ or K+/H+ antiporter